MGICAKDLRLNLSMCLFVFIFSTAYWGLFQKYSVTPDWGYMIPRGFGHFEWEYSGGGSNHKHWRYPGYQSRIIEDIQGINRLIRGYPGVSTKFIVRTSRGFPFSVLDIQGVLKLEKSISSIGGKVWRRSNFIQHDFHQFS